MSDSSCCYSALIDEGREEQSVTVNDRRSQDFLCVGALKSDDLSFSYHPLLRTHIRYILPPTTCVSQSAGMHAHLTIFSSSFASLQQKS